ncbi:hypothetical protein B0H14DRAFT_2792453 [Mycena olivaceomarginata]|nr:hypothetical protein B0H14DRAFT_2792453 [Mycena olivaceomarginata]
MLKRAIGILPPRDFTFLPTFFSLAEQRILLATALRKLDAMESIQSRRRRKALLHVGHLPTLHPTTSNPVQDCFLPEDCYEFEEGHYDGVIKHFREMHLTSWPSEVTELSPVLKRLHSLFPGPEDIQTHLLHLASNGEIHPHVDNLSASGSWILGVSLGAERLMHLEPGDENGDSYQVLLPSGSVYIQRDSLRYHYKHSIGPAVNWEEGQRVSIMIRDRLPDSTPRV